MRISDWISDVCSSDLVPSSAGFAARAKGGEMIVLCSWSNLRARPPRALAALAGAAALLVLLGGLASSRADTPGTATPENGCDATGPATIQEIGRHTSELQSLMRISYAVFCLKKKKRKQNNRDTHSITQTLKIQYKIKHRTTELKNI